MTSKNHRLIDQFCVYNWLYAQSGLETFAKILEMEGFSKNHPMSSRQVQFDEIFADTCLSSVANFRERFEKVFKNKSYYDMLHMKLEDFYKFGFDENIHEIQTYIVCFFQTPEWIKDVCIMTRLNF